MAARRILLVTHSRTGSTARLRDAVLAGIADAGGQVEVSSLDVTDADVDDVRSADAVVFATPARFGGLAGLTRDLLERVYPWFEELPDVHPGMPWTAVVKGASDPSGAVRDLERILTGLRWKQVVPPVQCVGALTEEHLAQAREAGATIAAGLDAGIW